MEDKNNIQTTIEQIIEEMDRLVKADTLHAVDELQKKIHEHIKQAGNQLRSAIKKPD